MKFLARARMFFLVPKNSYNSKNQISITKYLQELNMICLSATDIETPL